MTAISFQITAGTGLIYESSLSYPVELDSILGSNYSVLNFGRSSATMLKSGNLPYWNCNEFHNVFASKPDIITITLGTNDSKNFNWDASKYEKDFQSMIDTFNTIQPKPRIVICTPPPVFKMAWSIDDNTIVGEIIPIVEKIAKSNELQLIDFNGKLRNEPKYFPDGVHPDKQGATAMAEIIATELIK